MMASNMADDTAGDGAPDATLGNGRASSHQADRDGNDQCGTEFTHGDPPVVPPNA
jgi:hypothetical protein